MKKYGIILIAIWTIIIGSLASATIYAHHVHTIKEAEEKTRSYFHLNLFYRAWASKMGGIYVPADKVTPNQYLQVPDRDITASDNRQLTLVNPAFMTQMVFNSILSSSPDPIINKITSLQPLNPINAPDEWERKSLVAFERQQYKERSEVTTIDGKPYLRLISMFTTDESCLKCHAHQGYRKGDVRGAITISVPLIKAFQQQRDTDAKMIGGYFILWMLGSFGIGVNSRMRWLCEKRLMDSEQKFRSVCDWTQDWEYWLGSNGKMKYVSPSCLHMTGYTQDEFMEDSDLISRIISPDYKQAFAEHCPKNAAEPGIASTLTEFQIITRTGDLRWMQHSCRQIFDGDVFLGYRASNRDITEQKQAEELIRESERRFRAVAESSPLAIYLSVGLDQKGEYMNPTFTRLFGYTLDDIPDVAHWWSLAYPDETYRRQVSEEWHRKVEHAIKTSTQLEPMEVVVTCKDGSQKNIEWGFQPIGEQNWTFGHDLSERYRAEKDKLMLEQKFQQTQKLESLGVLAGGIAHDFNNILTIIMGNCALASLEPENAATFIPEIEKASERAAELCRQMLAYAGKAQIVQAEVNIGSLVDETVKMLKRTVPQNAEVKLHRANEIPCIQGDASQLNQIIMNLIINASEAIGTEQGEIHVSLAETTIHENQAANDYNGTTIPPGRYVCLEVTDNGCGMNEETQRRIFEPFYSTKFTGRGLGMSAVLGIIMSHKGALQLYSRPEEGTTFKVYLPITDGDSAGKGKNSLMDTSTSWMGSGTILLVEDEEQVRYIAKTMLKKMGFTVIEAVNGKEALELYHRNAADITLVVTDMGMPVMDGYALIRELNKLDPAVPIAVSSGFGEAEVDSRISKGTLAGLINKPYNFDQLRVVIKDIVEGIHQDS